MTIFAENNILNFSIFFDYNTNDGFGNFNYAWEENKLIEDINTADQYIILIIFLYARMLNIGEKSNRQNMINFVKHSISKVYENLDRLDFPDWSVKVFNKEQYIWPVYYTDEKITKPKIYKMSLIGSRLENIILKVYLDFGLEKILIPSSILIGLYILTRSLNDGGLFNFYKLFIEFNDYLNWDAKSFKSNRKILKAYDSIIPRIKEFQKRN